MRKIYILAFCLITIQASAQWNLVGTPFAAIARGLFFLNEDTGYATGEGGQISKTIDGGVTWTAQTSGVTTPIRSVYFLNNDTGWICGFFGVVLKTTDGGANWVSSNSGVDTSCRAVCFTSSDVGFLAGAAGVIYKTTDGGANWSSYSLGVADDVIQLKMVDANTGYVVCAGQLNPFAPGYIYKTSDGGSSWNQVYSNDTIGFLGLAIVDESTVYAGGTNDFIVKTTDGGATWNQVHIGILAPIIRCGYAASGDNVFFGNDGAHILQSADQGVTWTDTTVSGGLYSMSFPTPLIGYTGDASGNVYRMDVPQPPPPPVWTQVTNPFPTSITVRGLFFLTEDEGYAVGGNQTTISYISKTTDGGASWAMDSFTVSTLLRAASFVNHDTGFVCGFGGVLFQTTDAGATWNVIYTNAIQNFRTIDFVSPQVGFMGGATGTILKTTDGGTSWTTYNLDQSTSDVIQLDMVDENTGYAVCAASTFDLGYVYKTSDGGESWTQMWSDASIGYLGLAVGDINTVYVGGQNDIIIKSTDGGASWNTVYSDFPGTSIRGGDALSSNNVYMVDASNFVFNTTDGGTTWVDTTLTAGGLFAVHFPSTSVGYTGGGGGVVYKIQLSCTPVGAISEISGSTDICNSEKYEYSVEPVSEADSYDWSLPEGATIVAGEGTNDITVVFGENSGTISVTGSNACSISDASSIEVTVNIAPPIPNITFSNGVLSSDASEGNQWYYNGAIIPGATDQNYTPSLNGTYYVQVTSAEGCVSQSQSYDVIGVGIDETSDSNDLTISPNPMDQFTQIIIAAPNASRLIVSDVQGRIIINLPISSSQIRLGRNGLSEGVYMIQLMNKKDEMISYGKLIVQ